VSAGPDSVAAPRVVTLPRPPRWLVGWWAAGRLVVVATALAVHPSVWTLGWWDGRWYRMVARDGYLLVPGRQSDPAFFPLYPILLRGVHALGIGWGVAGPLVSNLGLLAALVVFHALTRELFDPALARRATTYLAVCPLGYVFSMTYPESVVLGLVAGAALAALRGRWWLATACAAAAALARPEALFLALPLAGIAWRQRRTLDAAQRGAALAAALAPGAALASYPLYLATVLHDPLAWSRAERAWGRHFRPFGAIDAFRHLPSMLGQNAWIARDVVCFALYVALLVAARRAGTPPTWIAAGAAVVVLPVFSGAFDSIGRFGLLAPPLFWGLASLTRDERADRAVRIGSLVLLGAGTVSLAYVFP
jgi:hypothetical protein